METWQDKILILLKEAKNSRKNKYLSSVLGQTIRYGTQHFPTENQLRIIKPMWAAREKRKIAEIIGD